MVKLYGLLAQVKITDAQTRLSALKVPLKEIIIYAEPKMRYQLSNALVTVCTNDNAFEAYQQLVKLGTVRTVLPSLFIAAEIGKEPDAALREKLVKDCHAKILKKMHRDYKRGNYLRPCVAGFQSIFQADELALDDKINLAHQILSLKDRDLQKEQWILAQGLALCNEMGAVASNEEALANGNLEPAFHEVLRRIFKLSPAAALHYQQTFGAKASNTSLLTYYGKMMQLPEEERADMLATLNDYVAGVLSPKSEEFYSMRYDTARNPHLKNIFKKCSWLENAWRRGCSARYDDIVNRYHITPKPFELNIKDFLVQKVLKHKHLAPKYSQWFGKYIAKPAARKEIEARLTEELERNTLENDHRAKSACHTQLALIEACEYSGSDPKIQSKLLRRIEKALPYGKESREFENDLKVMIRNLLSAHQKFKPKDTSGWRVVDTDDYWLLFMAGTYVEGSCQRVDGDPELNKCLMGYVLNGDYRMIAIVDENDTIIARCIIHLMDDPKKVKPVLFVEEPYPSFLDSVQKEVLEKFAIERSVNLGLTSASLEGSSEMVSYGRPLVREVVVRPMSIVMQVLRRKKKVNLPLISHKYFLTRKSMRVCIQQ